MEHPPPGTRQRIDHVALWAEACGYRLMLRFEPQEATDPFPDSDLRRAWTSMSDEQRHLFMDMVHGITRRKTAGGPT
jgi:hypothetical protein